jgi:para-nitrobenzyl esterase
MSIERGDAVITERIGRVCIIAPDSLSSGGPPGDGKVVDAEVETRYGRIRGSESGGVRSFRGVPFAAPLNGARRFLPPQPPEPWAGTLEATRAGASAPQFAMPVFRWINLAGGSPGADCLSLNVWTPGLDAARRPVLVWVHGGGFLVGSGSTPVYRGHDLALRGDVVVVTINYRLGALGYAHLGALLDDGLAWNLGVRDQIAALEWVRDHVDRFGGDPDNVTVFGQSAGGMSVAALLGAPRARALFHRAVCMSGAGDHVIEPERAQRAAEAFMAALGGPPASHEALARIPVERILRAQHEVMTRMADLERLMVFLPAVDGDLIPEQPLDALRRGAAAHIPILTGTTLEEWKLFRLVDGGLGRFGWDDVDRRFAEVLPALPGAPDERTASRLFREALGERSAARRPYEVWSAFQSARVFHHASARLAEAQHAGGGSVHAYLFTWRPPTLRRALGACHALDIPFVFGSTAHPLARPLTGVSAAAPRLSRTMQQSWIRFARDGEPGHARLPAWPPYDPERRTTMIFGRRSRADDAPLEAERELLESWSAPAVAADRPRRRAGAARR